MKIIKTEYFGEGESKYKVETYDNGAVVRSGCNESPTPLPTLSDTDEAILNTNANVEYLVALSEL